MNFEIGKKIRLLRLSRGMTQEKLAENLCVSAQSVSKWENCVTAPDIQLLPEISVQLGVTIDELFSITDESRLQRIETLLSTSGSATLIPHSEFENYRQFLVEHKDSSALRGRILTALASLYDRKQRVTKHCQLNLRCKPLPTSRATSRTIVLFVVPGTVQIATGMPITTTD